MKQKLFNFLALAAAAVFLLAGCMNILEQPKESYTPQDVALGAVRVSIAGQEAARTIAPDLEAGFTRYELVFTGPEGASHEAVPISGSKTVELETGAWTITAWAYAQNGGTEYKAATGSAPVTIVKGQTASANITLTLYRESGKNGTFTWNAGLSGVSGTYTAALSLVNADGSSLTGWTNVDLKNAPTGSFSAAAGYYLARMVLVKPATAGIPKSVAAETEAIHIYGGLEAVFTADFSDADFRADMTPPAVTPGAQNRTSDTTATVRFTSSEAGTYYYLVLADGAAEPTLEQVLAGTHGACGTAEMTLSLSGLSAGAKDVYIAVKDDAENVSSPVKIDLDAPLVFSNSFSIPDSIAGTAIASINVAVSGGMPPYTFSATGLPAGISIDPATGVISGTPTAASGGSQAEIKVTDSRTPTPATKTYTMNCGLITQRSAYLYDNGVKQAGTYSLAEAFMWISENNIADHSYKIELFADDILTPRNLTGSAYGNGITITLVSDSPTTERTITAVKPSGTADYLFRITHSRLTLVLDDHVTLQGSADNTTSLVVVQYGNFIMKANSKITGYGSSGYAGGVYVGDFAGSAAFPANFTMEGGTISGNTGRYGDLAVVPFGTVTLKGAPVISGITLLAGGGDSTNYGKIALSGALSTTVPVDLALDASASLAAVKTKWAGLAGQDIVTGTASPVYTPTAADYSKFNPLRNFVHNASTQEGISAYSIDTANGKLALAPGTVSGALVRTDSGTGYDAFSATLKREGTAVTGITNPVTPNASGEYSFASVAGGDGYTVEVTYTPDPSLDPVAGSAFVVAGNVTALTINVATPTVKLYQTISGTLSQINAAYFNVRGALSWITANAAASTYQTYTIELIADDTLAPYTTPATLKNKNSLNVFIVLKGDSTERTITLDGTGPMFTISQVFLTLDNNVTLKGKSGNTGKGLVYLKNGFLPTSTNTFVMNAGSKITGNHSSGAAGGVYVEVGSFAMNGGTITENSSSAADGAGGVYVDSPSSDSTALKMSDGSITGNSAANGAGGIRNLSYYAVISGGTVSGNTGRYGDLATSTRIQVQNTNATSLGNITLLAGTSTAIALTGVYAGASTIDLGQINSASLLAVKTGWSALNLKGILTGSVTTDNIAKFTLRNFVDASGNTEAITVDFPSRAINTSGQLALGAGPGGPVSGTVALASGGAGTVTGVDVTLKLNGTAVTGINNPVQPGANGDYSFASVPYGSGYTVEAVLPGYLTTSSASFVVLYATSAPALTLARETAKLYDDDTQVTTEGFNLEYALTWIKNNAAASHTYKIELLADQIIQTPDYTQDAAALNGQSGVTIILTSDGETERTIGQRYTGNLFRVQSGTLVLGNKVTLKGASNNTGEYGSVVYLYSNEATFTMKDGSKITGNSNSSAYALAGGVFVGNGAFNMEGGTITGNTTTSTSSMAGGLYILGGTVNISGGTISGNTGRYGEISVSPTATIILSGSPTLGNITLMAASDTGTTFAKIALSDAFTGAAAIDLAQSGSTNLTAVRTKWAGLTTPVIITGAASPAYTPTSTDIGHFTLGNFVYNASNKAAITTSYPGAAIVDTGADIGKLVLEP